MIDYQKMYYILCEAASKAIDMPIDAARKTLYEALQEAEELYICGCDTKEETND